MNNTKKPVKAAAPQKNNKGKKKSGLRIGIGVKIFGGFLVPVAFMIVIGVTAYQKSAEGLTQKYEQSTLQTIDMAVESMDTSSSYMKAEALKYAFDSSLSKYFIGMYDSTPIDKKTLISDTRTALNAVILSNNTISNIHIIPQDNEVCISTGSYQNVDGFFKEYKDIMDGNFSNWTDSHDMIDEKLSLKKNDYIMAYQITTKVRNAVVVVDVSSSYIEEFLGGLDFGDGSVVGFVTPNGREIICGQEVADGETVFYQQDFYQNAAAGQDTSGYTTVNYNGGRYLFLYSRSEETGATIGVLVPYATIIKQAEEIKNITAFSVVVAIIAAIIVVTFIISGINRNMRRISRKLERVAEGDLTGNVVVKGRDEFNDLAGSATDMISQTRNLVRKVNSATVQLEESAVEVNHVSQELQEYSSDITNAIDEINEGMGRQSNHAQECVEKTDSLSAEIKEVLRVSKDVEKMVGETEQMIEHGIDIVRNLGERSRETNEITNRVGSSVEQLQEQIDIINRFVGTITDIAEQTNLLSLNASIEAARAGEAGRGFAVVAEQIRKLSDDSAAAANEIKENVGHISAQTKTSVDNTKEAEQMVALQTESVEEVVEVFRSMNESMQSLIEGLKKIAASTERADDERSHAVEAVRYISDIIEENASNAETVSGIASNLFEKVESLNRTSNVLGENMTGLKREIEAFKTEE